MRTRCQHRIVPPLVLSLAMGCATTSRDRPSVPSQVRTITSIGDRPLPVATGEPGATVTADVLPPTRRRDESRTITGRVRDETGHPVADAVVSVAIDGSSAGRSRRVTTDATGRFTLANLREGSEYTLIAECEGPSGVPLSGRVNAKAPDEDVEIALSGVAVTSSGPRRRVERASETNPVTGPDDLPPGYVVPGGPVNEEDVPPAQQPPGLAGPVEPRQIDDGPGWRRSDQPPDDRGSPIATERASPPFVGGNTSTSRAVEEPNPLPPAIEPTPRWSSPASSTSAPAPPVFPPDPDETGRAAAAVVAPGHGVMAAPPGPKSGPSEELIDKAFEREITPTTPVPPAAGTYPGSAPALPEREPEPRNQGDPGPEFPSLTEPPVGSSPDGAREQSTERQPAPGAEPTPPSASEPGPPPVNEPPPTTQPEPEPAPPPVNEPAPPPVNEPAPTTQPEPEPGPPPVNEPGPPPVNEPAPGPPPANEPAPTTGSPAEESQAQSTLPRPKWGELVATGAPSNVPTRNVSLKGRTGAPSASAHQRARPVERPRAAPRMLAPSACDFDHRQERLIDFVLPDVEGKPIQFRALDADLVLLDFWGTWCGPCLTTIPHLVELQRAYGADRLKVVGIAYEQGTASESARAVASTAQRMGINYTLALGGADGRPCPVQAAFQVQAFPTMVLLDRTGRVLWRGQGASTSTLARLDRVVSTKLPQALARR